MSSKVYLPHSEIVVNWKEGKVIKWLRRMHLDDCIPAFEIRHIDGSKLLELTEQKLFTFQDLKIKHRKQIAKCVQECKSQASNAKRVARTIKHRRSTNPGTLDSNGAFESDEDSDDWGSDFEEESDDEIKSDQVPELNNNTIIQSSCNTSDQTVNLISTTQQKPQQGKFIPQPPDVPVISKNINGTVGRRIPTNNNSIPRPPIKRPPSQPPPPPVAQTSSPHLDQEDYEIPIVSTATSIKDNSEISDLSFPNVISNNFASETYELVEPPEETYEMVDAPRPINNIVDKPVLPPRFPLSSGPVSPPPPLPQKPKKLKDSFIHERPEGVRTFSRPKPKFESEPELTQSTPATSTGFIGTLLGRRSSNTPSSSPKTEHKRKDSHDGILRSNPLIISSSDNLSSRSSSPDKDGTSAASDEKSVLLLPPRYGSISDETTQNMATRPLPPVPIPKEKKISNSNQEELTSYPWFHEIERQTAEEVVKNLNEPGSFVVRPSKRAGIENPYSLTILHNDKLFHLNIRMRPEGTYALGKEKKIEKTFQTVVDLITFHQAEPILLTSRGEPAGKTILCKYPEKT